MNIKIGEKLKIMKENEGWLHKSLIKGKRFAIVNTLYQEGLQVLISLKEIILEKLEKEIFWKLKHV